MIIKEILNRRSVRDFKPDPVSDADITEIIKAAQFAPSAKHIRPAEFIVIKNQDTKNKLAGLLDQEFLKEAPVLIVPISDTQKSDYSLEDLSIASGYIFLQAAALGLGTVWKHVYKEERDAVKKLLNIPGQYSLTNLIPLGYPKNKPIPHSNDEFEINKIHHEKF